MTCAAFVTDIDQMWYDGVKSQWNFHITFTISNDTGGQWTDEAWIIIGNADNQNTCKTNVAQQVRDIALNKYGQTITANLVRFQDYTSY